MKTDPLLTVADGTETEAVDTEVVPAEADEEAERIKADAKTEAEAIVADVKAKGEEAIKAATE